MSLAFPAVPEPANRQRLFGMQIDRLSMMQAVEQVYGWLESADRSCRFVVTPNVDHVVQYQENVELRRAYSQAAMVVADGWPLVVASRLLGQALPERVPGSDLVPQLFAAAQHRRPIRVFLLGAAEGVAQRAADRIHCQWKDVSVVDTYSPPLGFETNDSENVKILQMINQSQPDLLVIGLGAPKQELWISRHHHKLEAKVALCVGATIDFLAGEKKRAPRIFQRFGLEWLHRMLSEPRRLVRRYAHDARIFPQLLWRQLRGGFQ